MKASFSIITVCSAGLKLLFGRNKTSRFFSAGNIALSSSFFVEDEEYIFENFNSTDNSLVPNLECISAESKEANELIFSGNDTYEFADRDPPISRNQTAEDDEMKTIKSILTKHGWNPGSRSGYWIDLNQSNIMQILNDLSDESSGAALALYFFRWSESCTGSKHSIQLVCRMIHILVSGNMNYRAMDLILHLVRNSGGEEGWQNLLLKVLHETHTERRVLQTVYSMLVDCYVKENMIDVALKSTCQMKHLNIFPSIGVCNSLLKALLGSEQLELAWDFLEDIHSQGNVDDACHLISMMVEHGIIPNYITLRALIIGFKKKWVKNPVRSAAFKLQQILIEYGIHVDVDQYLSMIQEPRSLGAASIFEQPCAVKL